MNFIGIIVGLCTFLIIGLCHPLVIKAEYHLGKGCWWLFLLAGLIVELFEQEKRVRKGWFPENPARKSKKSGR